MKKLILFAAVAASAMVSCQEGSMKPTLANEVDTVSYEYGMANSESLPMYMQQQGLDSIYLKEFLKGVKDGTLKGEDKEKIAYYLGVMYGLQRNAEMTSMEQQVFGDSTTKLNRKNFLAGLNNGAHHRSNMLLNGKPLDSREAMTDLQERLQKIYSRQFENYKKENAEYVAKYAKQPGVKKLPSGVLYKELTKGTGATAKAGDNVQLYYDLKLANGTQVESNYSQDQPAQFNTSQTIPGFAEALCHMSEGSEWEVVIPANLGYGEQGGGPIKPYSTLIFKVKVVSVSATPTNSEAPAN